MFSIPSQNIRDARARAHCFPVFFFGIAHHFGPQIVLLAPQRAVRTRLLRVPRELESIRGGGRESRCCPTGETYVSLEKAGSDFIEFLLSDNSAGLSITVCVKSGSAAS